MAEEDRTIEGKLVIKKENVSMPCPYCQVMIPCEVVYCTDPGCGGHGRINLKAHSCPGLEHVVRRTRKRSKIVPQKKEGKV